MYYCDMGKDTTTIRVLYKPSGDRTVGRYVTVEQDHMHMDLRYRASTIVQLNAEGKLIWYKHRDRKESALLTLSEQENLLFQILQSEAW